MVNSSTVIEHISGISLQAEILNIQGNKIAVKEIIDNEKKYHELINLAAGILHEKVFMNNSLAELYISEITRYGEIEAMRRLVERHKEITPK